MSLSIYEPTAEKIVHNTSADFILRYTGDVVHVVQYDDSLPILAVALYRNGKPYTVSAEEVNIRYGKPDGTFVYNPALGKNEAGNVVYFEVTQQMTSAPGKARLAVEVVDGGTACSGTVMMEVERNPVQEDAIESTDEFQTVGQQIEEKVQAAVREEMSFVGAKILWSGLLKGEPTYGNIVTFTVPEGCFFNDGKELILLLNGYCPEEETYAYDLYAMGLCFGSAEDFGLISEGEGPYHHGYAYRNMYRQESSASNLSHILRTHILVFKVTDSRYALCELGNRSEHFYLTSVSAIIPG